MPRCLYNSSISSFLVSDAKAILGSFGINYHGDILTSTDVVLLLRGIVFCLEFKVGQKDALQADIEQDLDYALDLKNFHLL